MVGWIRIHTAACLRCLLSIRLVATVSSIPVGKQNIKLSLVTEKGLQDGAALHLGVMMQLLNGVLNLILFTQGAELCTY